MRPLASHQSQGQPRLPKCRMDERKRIDIVPLAGCEPSIGLMADMLEDATREWRGEIMEVADAAVVWQPYAGGPSMSSVMAHMILVEAGWIENFVAGKPVDEAMRAALKHSEFDIENGNWPEPVAMPWAEYLAMQSAQRVVTLETLKGITDPDRFAERWEKYLLSVRWVVNHVVGHESYHGGQLVLLHTMATRR